MVNSKSSRAIETIHLLGKQHKNCTDCKYSEQSYVPPEFINVTDETDRLDVLIVGEAPGSEEEKQKRPFIGKSGQVIRPFVDTMANYGLSICIVNAVNCRPPRNETPQRREIKTCSFILASIITKLKPKSIICLGSVAMDSMRYVTNLKDELEGGMIQLAGRVLYDKKLDTYVIVAPHPAQYVRTRIAPIFEEIKLAFLLILEQLYSKYKDSKYKQAIDILEGINVEHIQSRIIDIKSLATKFTQLTELVTKAIYTFDVSVIERDKTLVNLYRAIEKYRQTKKATIDLKGFDVVRITPYFTTDNKVGYIRFWFRKDKELKIRDILGYVPAFVSKEALQKSQKEIPLTMPLDRLETILIPLNLYSRIMAIVKDAVFDYGQTIRIPGLYFVQERPEQTWAQILHVISANMGSYLYPVYVDIEVMHDESGSFPNPNTTEYPIVVITVYDPTADRFTIHALNRPNVNADAIYTELKTRVPVIVDKYSDLITPSKIDLRLYGTERELIEGYLEHIAELKPDIVTGWNVFFDVVYIYNRAATVKAFGYQTVSEIIQYLATKYYQFPNTLTFEAKLYYPSNLFEAEKAKPFANVLIHDTLDMLSLYKWLTTGEKRSYSLDYTAKSVLKISGKLKHSGSIAYLFEHDPVHLYAYNLLDVALTVLLDRALIMLSMANEVRHISGQTILNEYSHLRTFPPSLYVTGLSDLHEAIVGTRPVLGSGSPPLTAAFVREPVPGIYG